MKSAYLVCYDISSPRRLGRVFRLMKGTGVHLQYSVFLCSLTWPKLTLLKAMLDDIINPGRDDVRIYPLPSGCKARVLGRWARIPEGIDIFFEKGLP